MPGAGIGKIMGNLGRTIGVQVDTELRSWPLAMGRIIVAEDQVSCGVYHVVSQDTHCSKLTGSAGGSGAGSELAKFEHTGPIVANAGFDKCEWPGDPSA